MTKKQIKLTDTHNTRNYIVVHRNGDGTITMWTTNRKIRGLLEDIPEQHTDITLSWQSVMQLKEFFLDGQ